MISCWKLCGILEVFGVQFLWVRSEEGNEIFCCRLEGLITSISSYLSVHTFNSLAS